VTTRAPKRRCGEAGGAGILLHDGVTLLDLTGDAPHRVPADVGETGDAVRVRIELPGVSPKKISVTVRGSRIEVSGEKRADPACPNASYLCMERSFGRFSRLFDVTGSVNLHEMRAIYRMGVLELVVPKVAERRGRERKIRIETPGGE
jgi:HSP20 family protein